MVKFYKFSKRKDLDISTVSAGFRLELTTNQTVKVIKLAYGGMAEIIRRAKKTENFLIGKKWNRNTVEQACAVLDTEFKPITDARASSEGRSIAAKNLLIKFWVETKTSDD